MLYEIYKPLLWRALDAANGLVRANALSLFLDVFPLIPSNFPKVQFQSALEEQCSRIQVRYFLLTSSQGYNKLLIVVRIFIKIIIIFQFSQKMTLSQELLKDENEVVRVCAVRGCAKVLDRYWEILPAHHLMSLLTTLCCDMTHDMSSSEVVVAALQV